MNRKDLIPLIIRTLCLLFLLGLCVLSLVSCKSVQPTATSARVDSVYISTRDTVVRIEPDTATARLLLACDSVGNVILQELAQEQGKRVTAEIRLQQLQKAGVSFSWGHENGTVVDITCKADSLEQVIQMQRLEITKLQSVATSDPVPYIPSFYKRCTAAFVILCVLVFVYIVAKIAIRLRGL